MLCVLGPRPNKPSKPNRLHPKCSHKNCSNFVAKGIVHGGDGDDDADNVNDDNGDDGRPHNHNDDNADDSGGSGGNSRSGGRWDDNDRPSSSRPDKSRRGEEEGRSRKGGGGKGRASAAPITNEMLVANLGKIVDKRHTAPATTTTTPAREGGSAIEADREAVRWITASKIPVGDSASVLSSDAGGEVPPSFPMPQSTSHGHRIGRGMERRIFDACGSGCCVGAWRRLQDGKILTWLLT